METYGNCNVMIEELFMSRAIALDRITVNPNICLGQPTIRGMRITVGFVLKLLASELSVQDVLEAYPELEAEDIRQALNYAAWVVSDKIVNLPSA